MKIRFSLLKTFDWYIILIPIILVSIGIATIYSFTYYNDKIQLVYNQLFFFSIGLVAMVFFTFLDYRHLKSISLLGYLIGIVLLILVLFIGKSTFGASRWIDLKFFNLQPAEFFKLFIIIFLAKYCSDRIGNFKIKDIIWAIIAILIPIGLILRQPDLGSASVIFIISLSLILISRIKKKHLLFLLLIGILSLPVVWFNLMDYQKERIYTFLEPSKDRFGSGYNIMQSTITVGSGGLLGRGLGHGPQSQLNFIPVVHTDFIFAGLAEASGFLGSIFLLVLFLILIFRTIEIARISRDSFGVFLSIGIATVFLFQFFVNIGMNIGIMPVTGITLPFVSYGGSSMLLDMILVGILQSIYLRHKKITF